MANKYDIKSVQQDVTNTPVDLGIGAVPQGKTRFITFLKMTATAADSTLTASAGSDATTPVTTKDKQLIKTNGDTIMYPDTPSPEAPLFSIPEKEFLVLATGGGAETVSITVGYFDE